MIKKFLNPDSAWETSTFSDIPALPDTSNSTIRHFCIVAGGLALILSRNRDAAIASHYSHSAELYDLLSKELRKYGKTSASAGLINNVLHEVAQVADPLTMESLKKCLEFRRQHNEKRSQGRNEDAQADTRGGAGSGFIPRYGERMGSRHGDNPSLAPSQVVAQTTPHAGAAIEGHEAAQRLKEKLEQARRHRMDLRSMATLLGAQSSKEGKATSSL